MPPATTPSDRRCVPRKAPGWRVRSVFGNVSICNVPCQSHIGQDRILITRITRRTSRYLSQVYIYEYFIGVAIFGHNCNRQGLKADTTYSGLATRYDLQDTTTYVSPGPKLSFISGPPVTTVLWFGGENRWDGSRTVLSQMRCLF